VPIRVVEVELTAVRNRLITRGLNKLDTGCRQLLLALHALDFADELSNIFLAKVLGYPSSDMRPS